MHFLIFSGRATPEIRKVELALGAVRFDTVTDCSALGSPARWKAGSRGHAVSGAECHGPGSLSRGLSLNQRPAKVYRELGWPDRAMREHVEAL